LECTHEQIRRLMREHDLQPRIRRRFVVATDSDHDGPIFLNLAISLRWCAPDGRGLENCHRPQKATTRLHPSFRSRLATCSQGLPKDSGPQQPDRLNGTSRPRASWKRSR